ncbi:uncharacterized protein LOC114939723 [Nylanderia fulva]|uniref:uncharacterized protein LOC114939723 n=1 Tax=Nylanderia fulva TaxID=613905 RepID=UPI0010FAD673|nr:uncharacterized protein LOC114939723 [Nylanderia fulva]
MGLKWFRARLSIKKEASKVPAMTGLYRRVSPRFESNTTMPKNEDILNSPDILNTPTVSSDNYAIVNTEPSTSTKNSNLKEQSLSQYEELNNINTEQNDSSDKSRSDNELVI